MELNVNPTTLTNQNGTTFFQISSKTKINIYGNLGIGTDIPLTNFHLESVTFDDKVIQIPTSSNIYNYRALDNIYSLVPAGSIIIYPIDSSTYLDALKKLGWYECNGQTLLGSNFPVLSKVIAGQFGNTNPVGEYITLPDFSDRIGIGSTAVGYISPADNPLYASPSNLYSNTIINTINPDYSINLTYNNLPNHTHYVSKSEDAIAASGDGSHYHTYEKANNTDTYQGTPGGSIINAIGTNNSKTISVNFSGSSSGTGTNAQYDNHSHGETLFKTDADGKACTPNLTTGSFSVGNKLNANSIPIRQASLTMIYLLKCL